MLLQLAGQRSEVRKQQVHSVPEEMRMLAGSELTLAGQKTLKDEIWKNGVPRRPFHCQWAILQKAGGRPPESLPRPAGNGAVGSVQSVQRARFLQRSTAILGKAARLL